MKHCQRVSYRPYDTTLEETEEFVEGLRRYGIKVLYARDYDSVIFNKISVELHTRTCRSVNADVGVIIDEFLDEFEKHHTFDSVLFVHNLTSSVQIDPSTYVPVETKKIKYNVLHPNEYNRYI